MALRQPANNHRGCTDWLLNTLVWEAKQMLVDAENGLTIVSQRKAKKTRRGRE